jgi:hypothetical protein
VETRLLLLALLQLEVEAEVAELITDHLLMALLVAQVVELVIKGIELLAILEAELLVKDLLVVE